VRRARRTPELREARWRRKGNVAVWVGEVVARLESSTSCRALPSSRGWVVPRWERMLATGTFERV
jgi:hypothetical protein